jgi:hypothetical protein
MEKMGMNSSSVVKNRGETIAGSRQGRPLFIGKTGTKGGPLISVGDTN